MAYDKSKWDTINLHLPRDVSKEVIDFQKDLVVNNRIANKQEATRELVSKGLKMVQIEKELNKLDITTNELIERLKEKNGL